MTKRDLLKWLEEKSFKAIEAARKEYDASRGKAKEALLRDVGFEEMASEMQGHIEKASISGTSSKRNAGPLAALSSTAYI